MPFALEQVFPGIGKKVMDVSRAFDILEVKKDATLEEVQQAYKDLVNVWHPDRFSHNQRLKKKAEEKLKETNIAYERLLEFLGTGNRSAGVSKGARTEAAFEVGTEIVLTVFSQVCKAVRKVVNG